MQISSGRMPGAPVTTATRRLFVRPNPEMSAIARERALSRFVARGAQPRVALDAPGIERGVREFGFAFWRFQNSDLAAAIAAFVRGAGASA
jgi:hypothetical protein